MSLITEDGSIVPNADSFISLADARTEADRLGLTLPVDDTQAEIALRNAGRWINSQEPSFQGSRVSIDQTMSWPRDNVVKYNFDVPNDSIPTDVICSQLEAAAQIAAGVNPFPTDNGKEVKLQEVTGAVKREFFESGSTASSIELTAALNCLYPITTGATSGGLESSNFNVFRG
jgi:hypothetical protein